MSILVVGITGTLGQNFGNAAREYGVKLRVLVRKESINDPAKAKLFEGFEVVEGSLTDYASLVAACQGITTVIASVGSFQIDLEVDLVKAAAEAGVKRFIPSEFSCSLTKPNSLHMAGFEEKGKVRAAIKESGMEFTSIQSNGFMQWFAPACFNMLKPAFPTKVEVFGDGNVKLGMTSLVDVGRIAILAASDPRVANKHIVISFPGTLHTQNEMIQMWEDVSGTKVERETVSAEETQRRMKDWANDKEKETDWITALVVHGYVTNKLATCELEDGELRAEELYPQVKGKTLREFYEELKASKE